MFSLSSVLVAHSSIRELFTYLALTVRCTLYEICVFSPRLQRAEGGDLTEVATAQLRNSQGKGDVALNEERSLS